MKKLLLLLLCVPLMTLAQQTTYVPDDNFEAYLENNGMGNGIAYDDSVFTSAINTVTFLDVSMGAGTAVGIFDLTGIEDFIALTYLNCSYNQLTILDVSQNTALTYLSCYTNQLTSLNVSTNTALTTLSCGSNNLTSFDVSQNTSLTQLWCSVNQLTSLEVSNNTALTDLRCGSNLLTILDVRNGNNTNIIYFECVNNPNLTCINIDNATWSTTNWTVANGNIDAQHYFNTNCLPSAIEENSTNNKELLKVTDILGREANKQQNTPLFYIYDDGTVEKKIIIE